MSSAPRSVLNHNPGNIRIGQPWQGLCPIDNMTPYQQDETSFCVFKSPAYGFRALALTLLTYFRKYKLNTVSAIISRWAPSNENDTKAYAADVSQRLDVLPNQPINVDNLGTLTDLCRAISIHESGAWLFDSNDLNAGVAMALGASPVPPDDNAPIAA
jgi:hypothetical protein